MKINQGRENIRNTPTQVRIPIMLSLAVAGGMILGATLLGGSSQVNDLSDGFIKFREVLTRIDRYYVDTVDTEELVDYSITKMLEKLDPHTSYLNKEDAIAARAHLESGFDGIGVEFNIYNDTVYVVTPLFGGPSEEVGILSGDRILTVDDEPLSGPGVTNNKVFKMLRGQRGSEVKLGIGRDGVADPLIFNIIRNRIPTYSVDAAYMVDNKTGYIKVTRFSETTYEEFKKALASLKDQGLQQLILDLRGNPGGYMERAINMADEFISDDKLLVYTKGKGKHFDKESKAHIKGMFEEGPVIVLVDEGSASASEIVAGALQDHDRALIIGRRTFGKGLVQMPQKLSDGSELRLTVSRYYTPSGRSIQKPYQLGDSEEYQRDLARRFEHGEFFHADSIHLNRELKYTTSGGREVYGGGGIMPDVFVPRDSSGHSRYLFELRAKNIIRNYAVNYAAKYETELLKTPFDKFNASFKVNDAMLNEIIAESKKQGIEFNQEEFDKSKELIQLEVKALLGRYVWGKQRKDGLSNEIYQILNASDNIFQEALRHFDKAVALEKGNLTGSN